MGLRQEFKKGVAAAGIRGAGVGQTHGEVAARGGGDKPKRLLVGALPYLGRGVEYRGSQ